ncbi:MAG: YwaF family protein [Clostridia bacterium]|nr:YwaF family protein [Clostridia bacterium]
MYTLPHFVWLAVCAVFITVATVLLRKYNPPFKKVMSWACVAAVIAELVKTFSVMKLVPSADGSHSYVFLETNNLPLHLCSIQIIFIFYSRFAKDGKAKEILHAFMYPTCTIGAFIAILLPSIFTGGTTFAEAFLSGHPYEYFLYHSVLVILGLHIYYAHKDILRPKHYFTSLGALGVLAFVSLYLNSMFANPVYENGKLISVERTTNFFFTYEFVIDFKFTEIWHWYIYLASIFALACLLVALFYIPVFVRYFKAKKQSN